MPWADSAVFREWVAASLEPRTGFTGRWDGAADTDYRIALFDTSITPSKVVPAAQTAYGSGVWLAASPPQVVDPAYWPAGGQPLLNPSYTNGPGATVVFGGDNTTGQGPSGTLAGAMGSLMYLTRTAPAPLLAAQGAAYHYFGGGANDVTDGTFTIIWAPEGIMVATV